MFQTETRFARALQFLLRSQGFSRSTRHFHRQKPRLQPVNPESRVSSHDSCLGIGERRSDHVGLCQSPWLTAEESPLQTAPRRGERLHPAGTRSPPRAGEGLGERSGSHS